MTIGVVTNKQKQVEIDILEDLSWVETYQKNPILAAEDLLIRNDMPLILPPHQRIVIKDLWSGTPFPMLIMSRGAGKSTLLAIYLLLRAVLFPNERIGIISGSFRQAKQCFEEISRFYYESPIIRSCTDKPPTRGNDEYVLEITKNQSIIKALPLGDGQKLRGQRFFRIFVDEFPKVDKKILDEIIIPMLATRKNPTAPLVPNESKNQMILASTATWQFSWAYDYYCMYKEFVREGDTRYSVHEFDCDDLGDFLSKEVLEHSRKTFDRVTFLMEYKLLWPKDSHGYFPASLVSSIKRKSCLIEPKAKSEEAEYVLGVDPARTSDLFAMCVIRLSPNGNRVVKVETLSKPTYPEMAHAIRQVCRDFNIVRIAMDFGGGGLAVKDLLKEESIFYDEEKREMIEEPPILPIDPKESPGKVGRRILDVVYFSHKEIHQMNVDLKSDMEHQRIFLPASAVEGDELSEEIFSEIIELEKELRSIVVTVKPSGVLNFDTPSKRMIKDRYTALLLANKAAKDVAREREEKNVAGKQLAWGRWVY